VPKYALQNIAEGMNRVKWVGLDKAWYDYTLRSTHGLLCACDLTSLV